MSSRISGDRLHAEIPDQAAVLVVVVAVVAQHHVRAAPGPASLAAHRRYRLKQWDQLLSELIEAGKVRPWIDRRYRFADIPVTIAYLEQGHARAKVVVGVA